MASINRGPIEVVGADAPKTPTGTDKGAIITTITGQVSNLIGSIFGGQGSQSTPTSSTPPWLMPVIVGGIGVVAVTILATGKKKA